MLKESILAAEEFLRQLNERKRKRNTMYCSISSGGETILSHKDETRRLLKEVIDKIMQDRYHGIHQFKFLALLKMEKFSDYRRSFPEEVFDQLNNSLYTDLFKIQAIRRQLTAVYKQMRWIIIQWIWVGRRNIPADVYTINFLLIQYSAKLWNRIRETKIHATQHVQIKIIIDIETTTSHKEEDADN